MIPWAIGGLATKYAGKITYNIRFYKLAEDGKTYIYSLATRPKTGEILAMASSPTFDLSDPKKIEGVEGLAEDAAMELLNQRWKNFCISENYEPGSTAKPFTVAAGIESGKMAGNESYYCDGYQSIGGYNIKCVNRSGHGTETIAQAISNSCNDYLCRTRFPIVFIRKRIISIL